MTTFLTRQGAVLVMLTSAVLAQQPFLYYVFEDGSGTNMVNEVDPVGPGGSLKGDSGDARWVAGAPAGPTPDGGLDFDGQDSAGTDWIDTGMDVTGVGITDQDYTASFWFKVDTIGGDQFIFGTSGGTFWHLGIREETLYFGHFSNDIPGIDGIKPGEWNHAAFVYANGRQYLFLNGDIDSGPAVRDVIRGTGNIEIGRAQGNTRNFDGVLDEVAIWDVALSFNQIAALAGGASPTNLPPVSLRLPPSPLYSFQGTNGLWNLHLATGNGNGYYPAFNCSNAHAASAATSTTLNSTNFTGHLAWIESAEENAFVHLIAGKDNVWIGAVDNETYGGAEAGTNPSNGWVWAGSGVDTPPPYVYHNFFRPGEPNNAGGGEDGVHLRADGFWNDQISGLPGDRAGGPAYRFVIEWETQRSAPISGTRVLSPVIPDTLPGGPGAAEMLSVYELTDSGGSRTIEQVRDNLLAAKGTLNTGFITEMDVVDPDNSGGGGRFSVNHPLLGDQAGDDNFVSAVYKGRIAVPATGEWTFMNRSDNTTGLRIVGQRFIWANGNLCIDPLSTDTVSTRVGGGDNGRAGVVLAEGEYDIVVVGGDNTGGAHWEWFAALNRNLSESDTSAWQLIGSPGAGLVLVDPPMDIVIDAISRDASTGDVTLTWQSVDSASYKIEATSDYRSWPEVAVGVASQGTHTTHTVRGPFASPFTVFRIGLE